MDLEHLACKDGADKPNILSCHFSWYNSSIYLPGHNRHTFFNIFENWTEPDHSANWKKSVAMQSNLFLSELAAKVLKKKHTCM